MAKISVDFDKLLGYIYKTGQLCNNNKIKFFLHIHVKIDKAGNMWEKLEITITSELLIKNNILTNKLPVFHKKH